jgi:hypothetical protein
LGSQGDRRPNTICNDKIKQAPPRGLVKPGGIGNKKGNTNSVITKLKPLSEVSVRMSPKVRGCSLKRWSKDLISWENLKFMFVIGKKS